MPSICRVLLVILGWVLVLLHTGGCRRSQDAVLQESAATDAFRRSMVAGKNAFEQGDAAQAILHFKKALSIAPQDPDGYRNLAAASLEAGLASEAMQSADRFLELDPQSAAGYFIRGSALLRLQNALEAAKAFENVRRIEPGDPATCFQLGRARMGLSQWTEAIAIFREGLALDPHHLHPEVHFQIAQALLRSGQKEAAAKVLADREMDTPNGSSEANAATFERSKFTQPRVPFQLQQPASDGEPVRFVDATKEVLGDVAKLYSGPCGWIDLTHQGWNSLVVLESGRGFRCLRNSNGFLVADPSLIPSRPGAQYRKMLIADLQNDRFEDVIVLGDQGSHLLQFSTNGVMADVSGQTDLPSLKAVDGLLMDVDFTGKLDLVALSPDGEGGSLQFLRQRGPLRFTNTTAAVGLTWSGPAPQQLQMEDWNRDKIMDLVVSRTNAVPLLLAKQRGGKWQPEVLTNAVSGLAFVAADFDNDLRPDLAVIQSDQLVICSNGGERRTFPISRMSGVRAVEAFDYDRDGWLDVWVVGDTIRVWRNQGLRGFQEVTRELGFERWSWGPVSEIRFADVDRDCDSDLVVALAQGGLRYFRNESKPVNNQVKVRLFGNRSNASGIGSRIEIETGGLRLMRTVHQLPVEIGVGPHTMLDSFLVHWFNWPQGSAGVGFNCREPVYAQELSLQEGSCPFLYAWDGERFRFVTDILGSAPLGLPVAEHQFIESQPEELVWVGNAQSFPPKNGHYELRLTEELREVLYLDEAKLVVVDHEIGTEVHSTDKLCPGRPFPRGELVTLHREHPLQKAVTLEGLDVTQALLSVDGRRVSPARLRSPQLRGLAEPHGVVLDFGTLDSRLPLCLVLNGWLRFGGGMANIAASHDPTLPFPFPVLEMEDAAGHWSAVDVVVGAPSGKTKTILVDLEGKLKPGCRRLRLSEAFEIHWDRIALLEKKSTAQTQVRTLSPRFADLRFRGFSPVSARTEDAPPTPDYSEVSPRSYWTVIPGGWCTRYGDVLELVQSRDEGLALVNSGDELALRFDATEMSKLDPGLERDFFLYVDGWDKDSDFHVTRGAEVEPLPFHGQHDSLYGTESRPAFASDALHRRMNSRWVDSRALQQSARRSTPPAPSMPGM